MKEYILKFHVSCRFANVEAFMDKISELVSDDNSVIFEGAIMSAYSDEYGFIENEKLREALTSIDNASSELSEAYSVIEDFIEQDNDPKPDNREYAAQWD